MVARDSREWNVVARERTWLLGTHVNGTWLLGKEHGC